MLCPRFALASRGRYDTFMEAFSHVSSSLDKIYKVMRSGEKSIGASVEYDEMRRKDNVSTVRIGK